MKDKNVFVIGGGNTAMDAARTAKRLGGNVTIVYRRTQSEMPARVEELHHALEEGIALKVLRSPRAFDSEKSAHVCHAVLDVMELGPPTPRAGARPSRPARPKPWRSTSSSWRSATRRTRSSRTASRT